MISCGVVSTRWVWSSASSTWSSEVRRSATDRALDGPRPPPPPRRDDQKQQQNHPYSRRHRGTADLCPDRQLRGIRPRGSEEDRSARCGGQLDGRVQARRGPPVTDRGGIRGLGSRTWGCAHDREARHSGPSRRPRSRPEVKGFSKKISTFSAPVRSGRLSREIGRPLGYGVTPGAAGQRQVDRRATMERQDVPAAIYVAFGLTELPGTAGPGGAPEAGRSDHLARKYRPRSEGRPRRGGTVRLCRSGCRPSPLSRLTPIPSTDLVTRVRGLLREPVKPIDVVTLLFRSWRRRLLHGRPSAGCPGMWSYPYQRRGRDRHWC